MQIDLKFWWQLFVLTARAVCLLPRADIRNSRERLTTVADESVREPDTRADESGGEPAHKVDESVGDPKIKFIDLGDLDCEDRDEVDELETTRQNSRYPLRRRVQAPTRLMRVTDESSGD